VQSAIGVSTSLNYSIPRSFDTHNFSLGYSLSSISGNIGLAQQPINPYDTPSLPMPGVAAIASLNWSYSNAQSYLWSLSAEKGFSLSASLDISHPTLGSDYTGVRAQADFTTYVQMPWKHHHVLALHAGGGMMGGNFPGGPFYVGGWVDLSPTDQLNSLISGGNFLYQSGFVLRGYPVAVQTGSYYTLEQAEYHFPIVNIDRGMSTVPVLLNRISGNVFYDFGGAFNDPKQANFLSGVGAELWIDTSLGYFASFNFRVGYARGLSTGGIDKVYFVAAVPF
jgi:outer membrane protein assembly factor BamA